MSTSNYYGESLGANLALISVKSEGVNSIGCKASTIFNMEKQVTGVYFKQVHLKIYEWDSSSK